MDEGVWYWAELSQMNQGIVAETCSLRKNTTLSAPEIYVRTYCMLWVLAEKNMSRITLAMLVVYGE